MMRNALPSRIGLLLTCLGNALAEDPPSATVAISVRGVAHHRQGARQVARLPRASANVAGRPCRCRTPTGQSLRSSLALLSGFAERCAQLRSDSLRGLSIYRLQACRALRYFLQTTDTIHTSGHQS